MSSILHRPLVLCAIALLVALFGCSDDDPDPRPAGGAGGYSPGGSTNNQSDPDASFDADTDTSEADDDVGPSCDLEPSENHSDFRFPCCFTDQDCHDSDAPDAEDMICYHALCTEDAEGICRVPPNEELRCWDDLDCPETHACPYGETYQQFDCKSPNIQELPPFCIEQ